LGLNIDQLDQLIHYAKVLHAAKQEEIEKQKKLVIRHGGGKPPKLSLENQIVLTLLYLRHYSTFQMLGLMFQVSESSAHNIFNYWQSLLEEGLPSSLLEQVKKYPEDGDDILKDLVTQGLVVDSTSQVESRPSNYREQKRTYSGKKKNFTLKTQFIVNPETLDIVDISVGMPGLVHDITIWRSRQNEFSSEQFFMGDKAYVGESHIRTPSKKPKNGELTSDEKANNKQLSSLRIMVEHVIRLVKIFKVIQSRFRLSKSRYDSIFMTVCGLVRLQRRMFNIEVS